MKSIFLLLMFVGVIHAEVPKTEPAKEKQELTKEEYKEGFNAATERATSLERALFHSDRYLSFGTLWYDSLLTEMRQIRKENTLLKKQIQSARDYLERLNPPQYLSDITGKRYANTDTPLYREQVRCAIAEEKLKKERDDRALDVAALEAKISKLNLQMGDLGEERDKLQKERDKYKQQVEECRRYFQKIKSAEEKPSNPCED